MDKKFRLVVLPYNKDNQLFEQRESEIRHQPYSEECNLFNCIKDGNVEKLDKLMMQSEKEIRVGQMSKNSLRQAQYLAVAAIAIGIRKAIDGGMFEAEAYNLSDKYIQEIDAMTLPSEVEDRTYTIIRELAAAVNDHKARKYYSLPVKTCLNYIFVNLHKNITLKELAAECALSEDYLSLLFKKETGITLKKYIVQQKLEGARILLENNRLGCSCVGYYFDFCSESYFISCFKKQYGVTPREYYNRFNISR